VLVSSLGRLCWLYSGAEQAMSSNTRDTAINATVTVKPVVESSIYKITVPTFDCSEIKCLAFASSAYHQRQSPDQQVMTIV
jgi:hypothetical protein